MEAQEKRSTKEGTVVSNKMDKTVVVMVERTILHSRYKKVMKRGKKYYAHHEKNDLTIGERVRIKETRPLSKMKRWIVDEVLSGKESLGKKK